MHVHDSSARWRRGHVGGLKKNPGFCFVFLSDAQLEHNSKNRKPSLSPIILQQQEQEQKAKMAANVDITQVMSKLSKQAKEAAPPPSAGRR